MQNAQAIAVDGSHTLQKGYKRSSGCPKCLQTKQNQRSGTKVGTPLGAPFKPGFGLEDTTALDGFCFSVHPIWVSSHALHDRSVA